MLVASRRRRYTTALSGVPKAQNGSSLTGCQCVNYRVGRASSSHFGVLSPGLCSWIIHYRTTRENVPSRTRAILVTNGAYHGHVGVISSFELVSDGVHVFTPAARTEIAATDPRCGCEAPGGGEGDSRRTTNSRVESSVSVRSSRRGAVYAAMGPEYIDLTMMSATAAPRPRDCWGGPEGAAHVGRVWGGLLL